MISTPPFTVGIEEEYLLVDKTTRNLVQEVDPELMQKCESELQSLVSPEYLQCQIEVGTPVCSSMPQAKAELSKLRHTISKVTAEYGLAPIAASTHPFANWQQQKRTAKERYAAIEKDMQSVVRRLLISGMHVHVGIDDDDLRIDLLSQVTYILPHLLALSTSSPFWHGIDTGLMSYRIAVWDEMPRTGIPDTFESFSDYKRHVDILVHAGIIEDGSKLWWDVRPSIRFPTLEMRIADLCTNIDDAMCVATIYRCWLHMLFRLRMNNRRWRRYSTMLINENRWRAQRYGLEQGLMDYGRGEIVPCNELVEEIIEILHKDAIELDCEQELLHARTILKRGTSAHRQKKAYYDALNSGANETEAMQAVVDWLIQATQEGVEEASAAAISEGVLN